MFDSTILMYTCNVLFFFLLRDYTMIWWTINRINRYSTILVFACDIFFPSFQRYNVEICTWIQWYDEQSDTPNLIKKFNSSIRSWNKRRTGPTKVIRTEYLISVNLKFGAQKSKLQRRIGCFFYLRSKSIITVSRRPLVRDLEFQKILQILRIRFVWQKNLVRTYCFAEEMKMRIDCSNIKHKDDLILSMQVL